MSFSKQGVVISSFGQRAKRFALFDEVFIANLLRFGVFASILVCAIGSVLFLVTAGGKGTVQSIVAYRVHPTFPHTLAALARGISVFDPMAIIMVGLLMLVALRVLQVLLSAVTFYAQKNYKFMVISLFVFVVLVSSAFLGKAGG